MPAIDYSQLLPLILLGSTPVLLMLMIAVYRSHRFIFGLTLICLLIFIGSCFYQWSGFSSAYLAGQMLYIDRFSLYYMILLGLAGLVVSLLSYPYFERQNFNKEEYYVLLTSALFGGAALVTSVNFASFFLSLEILSVSLYVLIAYVRSRLTSIEGGLKYLILAAGSSAFLLFGMALIYFETGTLAFAEMRVPLQNPSLLATAGMAMMLVGFGFKLAVVPFHLWTPDVYQGAPAPVSAFIASVSKASVMVVLLRFLNAWGGVEPDWLLLTLMILAIASMLFGNLLALRQNNIKRLLAYSSIAHLGYILVAVIAFSHFSGKAISFYLSAYFLAILGSFGSISLFATEEKELENIEDLKGLFWSRPWLAAFFCVFFFSLVGIPLTAGFIGKYYLVAAGIQSNLWGLVIILVISSVIGLFYYLKVIVKMLSQEETEAPVLYGKWLGLGVLAVLGVLTLWLGIYPTGLIEIIGLAVR